MKQRINFFSYNLFSFFKFNYNWLRVCFFSRYYSILFIILSPSSTFATQKINKLFQKEKSHNTSTKNERYTLLKNPVFFYFFCIIFENTIVYSSRWIFIITTILLNAYSAFYYCCFCFYFSFFNCWINEFTKEIAQ